MDVRRTQTVPGIKTASSYSTAACLHVRAAVTPPNRPRTLRPAPCTTLKASRRPHSETLPEPRTHESPPAKALLSAAQTGSMNTREPAAHESPPAKALLSAILFALLCSRVSSLRLLLVRHFHWGRQHSPAFACATLPMGAPPPPYAVVQSLSCSQ